MAVSSKELIDLLETVLDDRSYPSIRIKTAHVDFAGKIVKVILMGYDPNTGKEQVGTRTDIVAGEEGTNISGHLVEKYGVPSEIDTVTYSNVLDYLDVNGLRSGLVKGTKNLIGE